jgi:formate dehydrogenase beta subunit
VFGPRLIIDSVADGKRAAVGIDEFLRGQEHAAPIVEVEVLERHRMPLDLLDLLRPQIPMLPLNRRTGVTEVEIGFDEEAAVAEAQRCLHCWVNTVFEGNASDGTSCILCGGCVDVCPENCLELVSLDRINSTKRLPDSWETSAICSGVELDDIKAEELGSNLRLGHAQRRVALHPLRTVRGALSRRHHHHGVLQPCFRGPNRLDIR